MRLGVQFLNTQGSQRSKETVSKTHLLSKIYINVTEEFLISVSMDLEAYLYLHNNILQRIHANRIIILISTDSAYREEKSSSKKHDGLHIPFGNVSKFKMFKAAPSFTV